MWVQVSDLEAAFADLEATVAFNEAALDAAALDAEYDETEYDYLFFGSSSCSSSDEMPTDAVRMTSSAPRSRSRKTPVCATNKPV